VEPKEPSGGTANDARSGPFPARYAPIRRLGAGGGGEVWSVRDRIDGRVLALKVLGAGTIGTAQNEVAALVREATTLLDLSSSTAIGLPRVERFGRLADGRPYLVRELVEGQSLAGLIERRGSLGAALRALLSAAAQLTQLHRVGLLHGDVKPANVIVREHGEATLVDLGLATAWGPNGARPEGLTPKYAAPELFEGEPLTVRAEVYALGVSLRDVLEGLSDETGTALEAIVRRATARDPAARHPSVDELAAAIAAAAGLADATPPARGIWTIVGLDSTLGELVRLAEDLPAGGALVVGGPAGAGGRTAIAALAWRLALGGWPIAWLRGRLDGPDKERHLALELATALGTDAVTDASDEAFAQAGGVLLVEDEGTAGARLEKLRGLGARTIVRRTWGPSGYAIAPLPPRDALELVRRALPSLPEAVVARTVERGEGRPGRLRAIVEAIGERAIVRAESVDVIVARLETTDEGEGAPASEQRIRDLLDAGRVAEAEALLPKLPDDARSKLLWARIGLAKGEDEGVSKLLGEIPLDDHDVALRAEHALLRAKLALKRGDYARVADAADSVLGLTDVELAAPAIAAEAMQSRGLAKIYRQDETAVADLRSAAALARRAGAQRIEALAESTLAMAHQRTGRPDDARAAYARAIAAGEAAGDPGVVANVRVNLGTLAWTEGDLARATDEFEAAADLARRGLRPQTVERALNNLAAVDLGLGRYARVATTLRSLAAIEPQMTAVGRAQLLGLEAELAARTGDLARAKDLYDRAIAAWRAIDRPQDAAEVVIDEVAIRRQRRADLGSVDDDLAALDAAERDLGARAVELAASLAFARAMVHAARGDEPRAIDLLEAGLRAAEAQGAKEWRWQLHAARARILSAQGSHARARRDADEAAAILEEIAAKLPRDLREVFWDEPRRRALRQVHEATAFSARPPQSHLPSTPDALPPATAQALVSLQGSLQGARVAEDRLGRILAINRDLAGEIDLERLLARITDQALDLLGADRGFVLLEGEDAPEREELHARAARDRRKDDPSVQFSRSVAERVLRTAEPIVTDDARTDERLGGAASVHALSIHSIACVPIPRVRGGDRAPIGVLYLETRGRTRGLDTRAGRPSAFGALGMRAELPTLLAFADQVGIAIANARLVDENRRRAEELAKANAELEAARAKLDELLARRTEQLEKARADLAGARQALRGHTGYAGFKGLVGASTAMRRLYALVDRVKTTDVPVLITGESGTGKEVVARAIHQGSDRGKRPFLGVNCGAIPGNLLESELFGHVRGAFTGADRDKKGLFREAEGGTILLDEIGEMPLKMQAGLLRVLQEKTVRPVGGAREESVDARVVCATHRDLEEMVSRNEFREDLFYRINVVAIRIPPLRERAEDIPLLCDYFLGVFAAHYRRERKTIARDAMRRLQAYHWPGNVRQLENLLLNAFVLSEGSQIEPEDLSIPETTREVRPSVAPRESEQPASNLQAHRQSEKDKILAALEKSGWNRLQAAKLCGIPRRTFYRRLKEYGIQE
jgi:transcriptional regulator with GAF, ATPase, and Fis domain